MLPSLEIFGREPTRALDGGPDGMSQIAGLIETAPTVLSADGALLIEIEANQGPSAGAFARKAFPHARIHIQKDLAGQDRLLLVEN